MDIGMTGRGTTGCTTRGRLVAPALAAALFVLGACDGPTPAEAPSAVLSEAPLPDAVPSADASAAAPGSGQEALDAGALSEKRNPERLLRYYTAAVRAGDWTAAARAWTLDAQVTPEGLAERFGGDPAPRIAAGKGDVTATAGSQFYEAPVVVDFAGRRPPLRGTIVLRRVSDAPGASAEQLYWRIERSALTGG